MIAAVIVVAVCLCGLAAGRLMFRTAPPVPLNDEANVPADITVIIPARNEEANIGPLLEALNASSLAPAAVFVMDDESEDDTAAIATAHGATVLKPGPRPDGWKGKPWACYNGALHATTPLLCFMDADTRLLPDGLRRMRALFGNVECAKAVSVLPFHTMREPYEQLSLYFNILQAAGAGGFTGLDAPGLFGQCLLIQRGVYERSGGHAAVKEHVLENLYLAPKVRDRGGVTQTFLGTGSLNMRMFPDGFTSLCNSWMKGFASGAKATPQRTMLLSIVWLMSGMTPLLALPLTDGVPRHFVCAMYLLFALQTFLLARRLGSYRWYTAALYPVPLLFYFSLFAASSLRTRRGKTVLWKGRPV